MTLKTRGGIFLLAFLAGALGAASTVSTDLGNVAVFPNPWRADQNTGESIKFGEIPAASTVKIFTVSGHWVATVQESGNHQAQWELNNDRGEKVQSGLYLFLISDPQGRKAHGKFAVLR